VNVDSVRELSELEKNENHETDKRKRFGKGDAKEHRGTNHASGFRLASHCLDGLADEVTDANSWSDCRVDLVLWMRCATDVNSGEHREDVCLQECHQHLK